MKVYITAQAQYQVQNAENYCVACFPTLLQANCYIRQHGAQPIYTWITN